MILRGKLSMNIIKVDRFGGKWFTDGAGGTPLLYGGAMEVILKMLRDKIFLITGG